MQMYRTRLTFIIVLLGLGGSLFAQKIMFMPQWSAQSQFAGYYVAKEMGFFKDAGLDVEIKHPSTSNSALNHIKNGECDIISIQLLQALDAIDKGTPLINILQTSQHNSLVIIPRNDEINTIEGLAKKRVGIWKVGFGEPALLLDTKNNLQIEWIPFIQNINLFISGAIDATLAMSYNEYWQILASGYQPKNVFYLCDYGIDVPEDGLYVTKEYYKSHKKEVDAFKEAVKKGWKWAANNPDKTVDIVMEYMAANNIAANKHHQRWMLKETLMLMTKEYTAERGAKSLKTDMTLPTDWAPSFTISQEQLDMAVELMMGQKRISKPITYQQITGGALK